MVKRLQIDPGKCIGCKSCEMVCSLFNDKRMVPARSRITTMTFMEGKYNLPYNYVWTCRQCSDAPCLPACPVGAISRTESANQILVVDRDTCIGCGRCISACPFGAILFDPVLNKAFKCELCGGEPACVEFCPTSAIMIVDTTPFFAQPRESELESYLFSKESSKAIFRSRKKPAQK